MAIVAADIPFRLTTKSGAAGNTTAQGNPALSLGKYLSTTVWAGGTIHDLFQLLEAEENAGLVAKYRALAIPNLHATLTLTGARAYFPNGIGTGSDVAVAVDTTAASLVGSASAQGLEATTDTAPGSSIVGLSYSAPTTYATGVALGDIGPGYCRFLWVRRTGVNGPAQASPQSVLLRVRGGTLG